MADGGQLEFCMLWWVLVWCWCQKAQIYFQYNCSTSVKQWRM